MTLRKLMLGTAMCFIPLSAIAQPVQYQAADNINNVPVSAATPLPVIIDGGGGGTVTANQGTAAAVSGGWPVIAGEPADTAGTFTNGTQSTAITTPSIDGYETATITINGTYGTASATFLASDDGGTTYYTLSCARTDSAVVETGYTSLTNVSRAWFCPIHSFDTIRVQSSAVASGTVNVRISISSPPTTAGAVVSVSAASTVGVEGADGATQASATNNFPVGPTATTVSSGITDVSSTSLESNHVLKGSAGNLYSVYVTTGAVAGYLLTVNSTTAPTAGGAAIAPVDCIIVPANTTVGLNMGGDPPDPYATGITAVFSTSGCLTNTASATVFFKGRVK